MWKIFILFCDWWDLCSKVWLLSVISLESDSSAPRIPDLNFEESIHCLDLPCSSQSQKYIKHCSSVSEAERPGLPLSSLSICDDLRFPRWQSGSDLLVLCCRDGVWKSPALAVTAYHFQKAGHGEISSHLSCQCHALSSHVLSKLFALIFRFFPQVKFNSRMLSAGMEDSNTIIFKRTLLTFLNKTKAS